MGERDLWTYEVQTSGTERLQAIEAAMFRLQGQQVRQDDLNRKSAGAWSNLSSSLGSHAMAIGTAAAAYLSLRAAVSGIETLVKRSIGAASQMETFTTQFVTLTGSEQAAREELERLFEFAAKTPFELPQVVQARKMMLALGVEGEDTMRIAGDAAAAMGKELSDAILAISQARFGEMERLKEFGISTQTITSRLGHEINRETIEGQREVADAVLAIFEERYTGGMERLSKTLVGVTSTLKDEISRTFRIIGEAGPMEIVKRDIEELLGILSKANEPGGATEAFADRFAVAFAKIESYVWAAGQTVLEFLSGDDMDKALARIENVVKGATGGGIAGAVIGTAAGGPAGALGGGLLGAGIGAGVSAKWPMRKTAGGQYVPAYSFEDLGISGGQYSGLSAQGSADLGWLASRTPGGPYGEPGAIQGPETEARSFAERQRRRFAETLARIEADEIAADAAATGGKTAPGAPGYVKPGKAKPWKAIKPPPGYEYGPMTPSEMGVGGEWFGGKMTEMGPPMPTGMEREIEAQERLREGWRATADDFEAAWADAFGQYEDGFVRMTTLSEGGMRAVLEATQATTAGMTAATELYLGGRLKQERILSRVLEASSRSAIAGFMDELKERLEKKSREAAIDAAVAFATGHIGSGAALAAASMGYAALAGVAGGAAANMRAEAEERMKGAEKEAAWKPSEIDETTGSTRATGGTSALKTSALTPTAITISVTYQHYGTAYYGAGGPDDFIAELAPAINRAIESGQIGPLGG